MPNEKADLIDGLWTGYSAQVPVTTFLLNLFLAAGLAWVLGAVYRRYGTALSNRKHFAQNFVMLAATTMIIITIVKSSLALSLGLVGALSIVRFRAAIKEPEELTYLFLCIAIGLGLGADQRLITLVGLAAILAFICVRHKSRASEENQNLHLTVASEGPTRISLQQMLDTLTKYCPSVSLKRFDENSRMLEASLLVEFAGIDQLEHCKSELMKLDESLTVSFLDPLPA